jgi:sugar transferase (PEP-CTERM/EpsH1 system associated)
MRLGILLSRFPYPIEKGDKLRAFHQIRELSKKHEIYLCALNAGKVTAADMQKVQPYCKEILILPLTKFNISINLLYSLIFGHLPLQVAYFYHRKYRKRIIGFFEENQVEHIYCQLIRVAEYLKNYQRQPKTLDYMDALSRGMERRIENSPFYLKPFIKIESLRLKRYEHFIFSAFDQATIISEQDRQLIVHAQNEQIQIVKNGVDQDYFQPQPRKKTTDILFTGNMSYPPNILAAEYLVEKIMPLVWEKLPNTTVSLAGASPARAVEKLKDERVAVTGWVDDIRENYNQARLFVAPMWIGTGLQNKLLEAMAMKLPCITTPLANNALKAYPEEEIRIGEDQHAFARHIIDLLTHPSKAEKLATRGYAYISSKYSWEASTSQLEALFLKPKQKHGSKQKEN